MSAGLRTFGRDLARATVGLEPAAIQRQLAAFAREELAGALARGDGSPVYTTSVNGRRGASEDSVRLPGPIVYDFVWWAPIITYALEVLRARSPVRSGAYRDAWTVVVGGQKVREFDALPADAQIHIVNPVPYARKIEVGHMKMSVPPGVVEQGVQVVAARYGQMVHVSHEFITLRGDYSAAGQFRQGRGSGARRKLRKDTRSGARMTYPALYLDIGRA